MKLPLVLAAGLSLFPAISVAVHTPAQAAPEQKTADIAGLYDCRGTSAEGKPYQGIVQIVQHNGVFEVVWTLGRNEQQVGIGIVTGDVLSVSYFGGMPGVVAYRIEKGEKGPRLVGHWTVPTADGQVFVETLTRVSAEVPRRPDASGPEKPRAPRRPAMISEFVRAA